ncbi:SRPBCC family protein [Microlunatus soli]|uniref:Ribosome association toxin PasT (RatA) of the RatAB toxin-antitoxin module n=1 Tax=Microlunatus soli TaxID=630515 RepID=A0A1H1PLF7_9ACTN|nr:SRPBCC family protein [Microlunatus soli]SDS11986.1 Ribosome association toxin PasT (RatA) of the RatAB toxin-antitoxin module [Microlunatus soli]
MANSTQSSIEIPADPDQVMAVIADLDGYPQWVDALSTVEVLTTRDDRPDTVRMVLEHKLLSDDYTVAYQWQPERVSWKLIEGRTLKAMDGSYEIEQIAAGTKVTYTLSVDVNLPLPGLLKRTAEKTIIDAALKGLKRQVAAVRDGR